MEPITERIPDQIHSENHSREMRSLMSPLLYH
jgi:hypothetical protein